MLDKLKRTNIKKELFRFDWVACVVAAILIAGVFYFDVSGLEELGLAQFVNLSPWLTAVVEIIMSLVLAQVGVFMLRVKFRNNVSRKGSEAYKSTD